MNAKIGIGLLLFGIILANGIGLLQPYTWIAGCVVGIIGLIMIYTDKSNKSNKD